MHILLRNETGGITDGILLAAGRNAMRVAIPGAADTLELLLTDGVWLAADEKFELDAVIAGTDSEMSNLGDALRAKTLTAGMPFSG